MCVDEAQAIATATVPRVKKYKLSMNPENIYFIFTEKTKRELSLLYDSSLSLSIRDA